MTITDEIKLMKNTIEMLQKTLNDMINKEASKNEVRLVVEAIQEKQDILNGLYEKLKITSNPSPEDGLWEKYTAYKPTHYTADKSDWAEEEKIEEFLNKCDAEKNYSNYTPITSDYASNSFNDIQFHMKDEDIHDEISKRNWVRSNMFLIKWPDKKVPVREYDFIGFYEDSATKSIIITAKDFISKQADGTFVFSKYLKEVSNLGPIKIEYLNGYGDMMYGEEYDGCNIEEVDRSAMSYNLDDVVIVEFRVFYDSKKFYDTTTKEKKD